jgi:hypothetical protein
MSWSVEYTDEFGAWWMMLGESEQDDIAAVVAQLEARGPQLPFRYSAGIKGSRHAHCASCAFRAEACRYASSMRSIHDAPRSC